MGTTYNSYFGVLNDASTKSGPGIDLTLTNRMLPILHGGGGSGPVTPVPYGGVLQNGTVSVAYSETINATGGTSPYTFAVTSGALPTGTSLNSSTGVISGTPSAAATYSFEITVTDSLANTGSTSFQIITSVAVSQNSGFAI